MVVIIVVVNTQIYDIVSNIAIGFGLIDDSQGVGLFDEKPVISSCLYVEFLKNIGLSIGNVLTQAIGSKEREKRMMLRKKMYRICKK